MLDDIREWISDNLRYILLGLAIILLIIIAVFAVRLVTHIGTSSSNSSQNKTEQQTDAQTEKETTADDTEESLVRNQEDLLDLATSYWMAIGDQDYDTLETLCGKTFDESARATVAAMDTAVESYNDIMTYSKSGLTDGSYVVYVYMELKLTGIETEAPTLREMYMQPDSDGTLLVVQTSDYTSEITAYVQERQKDSDVQALIADVSETLTTRCEEDEDLAQYIESRSTTSDSDDDSDDDSPDDSSDAALGTMQVSASTGVNVRSEASADSEKLGSLVAGSQVEVLENLDGGWSRISYIDSTGSTVEGYVMTEYLSAVG
ncbi:MAG: SH3 domain-containing protein [Lachnospiraceae bacterium]|nr:SH3 domain-containing protein [Lachnospiraceae bacterium]